MKKLFIGIDFSKEKLDATIILACGMNEIGSHKNIYGRDFDRNICQKLPPKFFREIPAFPRLPTAI